METHVVCLVCEEKTSTTFSYCRKCGAELLSEEKPSQPSQVLSTQEKSNFDSVEEDLNFQDQKCWVCEKIIRPESPFLNFCSETCERTYTSIPER